MPYGHARYFAAAPANDQARRIYWDDLKALTPKQWLAGKPNESRMIIKTIFGSQIEVVGLDKPERIEGSPWDGGIIDEIGNVKAGAWMRAPAACSSSGERGNQFLETRRRSRAGDAGTAGLSIDSMTRAIDACASTTTSAESSAARKPAKRCGRASPCRQRAAR